MTDSVIVWFRQDLRLEDNPAFHMAAKTGLAIIPVYIWAPEEEGAWAPGSASRFWLYHSLKNLDNELHKNGLRLILRQGKSLIQLTNIIKETNAKIVYWNRRYEPFIVQRDAQIKKQLISIGLEAKSFNASLLYEPHEIKNKQGKPYRVFTPFWKYYQSLQVPEKPLAKPRGITIPERWPVSIKLSQFDLLPKIGWAKAMQAYWTIGGHGAKRHLKKFINSGLPDYATDRDLPAIQGTSELSPYLHFGEISPRTIWHKVLETEHEQGRMTPCKSTMVYLSQLAWREFAHHLMFHFPHSVNKPLRSDYERFPWKRDTLRLRAWQSGETGYPIVDAGMRELWTNGWMHNRVRMIVASFLVKDLLIHWLEGARWFWDTLVDADLANNTMGWQWVAGSGADAAPYFRIFNPVTQGKRFDPDGSYVKKWIPELAALPSDYIHEPWKLTDRQLQSAGVRLGQIYPRPIVNHHEARLKALEALKTMKSVGINK